MDIREKESSASRQREKMKGTRETLQVFVVAVCAELKFRETAFYSP